MRRTAKDPFPFKPQGGRDERLQLSGLAQAGKTLALSSTSPLHDQNHSTAL